MRGIKGKVAIVFGGSSGIGRAIAVRLAAEGARIAVPFSPAADRGRGYIDGTIEAIRARGGEPLILEADLTELGQIEAAFTETERALGPIDFAINSAGVAPYIPIADVTEEDYERAFKINARGTFFFLKNAAKMVKDGGRILAFTSAASRVGQHGGTLYGGSKGAIEAFIRDVAWEVGPRHVTVNGISPGVTETPMLFDRFRSVGASMSPFGRLGVPEEVGDAACMLLSDDGRWVTGQILHAGGGAVMY